MTPTLGGPEIFSSWHRWRLSDGLRDPGSSKVSGRPSRHSYPWCNLADCQPIPRLWLILPGTPLAIKTGQRRCELPPTRHETPKAGDKEHEKFGRRQYMPYGYTPVDALELYERINLCALMSTEGRGGDKKVRHPTHSAPVPPRSHFEV